MHGSVLTWQVQEQQLQNLRTEGVQLGTEEEHTAAQQTHHCIEKVEYLLGGPTVLRYTDLDTNELHLWAHKHMQTVLGQ